ncbi:MAG TPA: hypothetical protein VJ063_21970, partial [Verrucomicrobiae bacterium]|nr:hypothetical protein [Verrucomicrobiae bacterium]
GLQDIHPPVAVATAYESYAGARQTYQAKIRAAEAHKVQTNALAAAEALRRRRVAEGDRERIQAVAIARAGNFTNQIPAYKAEPSVYKMRGYLATLSRAGGSARKIVVAATNAQDVFMLNLEEKFNSGLLSQPLPAQ